MVARWGKGAGWQVVTGRATDKLGARWSWCSCWQKVGRRGRRNQRNQVEKIKVKAGKAPVTAGKVGKVTVASWAEDDVYHLRAWVRAARVEVERSILRARMAFGRFPLSAPSGPMSWGSAWVELVEWDLARTWCARWVESRPVVGAGGTVWAVPVAWGSAEVRSASAWREWDRARRERRAVLRALWGPPAVVHARPGGPRRATERELRALPGRARRVVGRADVRPMVLAKLGEDDGRALSGTVAFGQAVRVGVSAWDARAGYAGWWAERAPERLALGYLGRCGRRAAGVAAGRMGRVSSTSRDEAAGAARLAVLASSTRDGAVDLGILARVAVRSDSLRAVRHATRAATAATASLRGGLSAGLRGEDAALRGLRVESIDLAAIAREVELGQVGGWDSDPDAVTQRDEDGARRWSDALALARACRRLRDEHLLKLAGEHAARWQTRHGVAMSAWARTRQATRARWARARAVLVWVALGESLDWACSVGSHRPAGRPVPPHRGGYAMESVGGSRAWIKAWSELGLAVGLAGKVTRGSIRPSGSAPTVTV